MSCYAAGILTIEDAFLAQMVPPTGETLGEAIAQPIAIAYSTGKMPPLLPGPSNA